MSGVLTTQNGKLSKLSDTAHRFLEGITATNGEGWRALGEHADIRNKRNLTREIIHLAAVHFLEHPHDPDVILLRKIAFSTRPMGKNRKGTLNWIAAISRLPEEMVPYNSRCWKEALNLAEVHSDPSMRKKNFIAG
jgi:hypothetical protein